MRRMDVVLSIAGALVVVLLLALAPSAIPGLLRDAVLAPALDYWYVGVAIVVASIVLGRRSTSPGLARALGVLGVAWVALVVGFYIALILVFALFPIAY
jgi:hypothetical protein